MFDDELLELQRERQLLHQNAVRLAQDGRARLRSLGHHQVAPEGGVGGRQPVRGGHVGNHAATRKGGLAVEPHLRAHDQVAIEQPPQADQHDGTVGCDVANLVGRTGLGRHHPARARARSGVALLELDLPAPARQHLADAPRFGRGILRQRGLGLVVKGTQVLFADVFLVGAQVRQNLGRVAHDAQRGADDQERQDHQEPPGAVHRVELQRGKQLGPERTELVHIVDGGLMLLEDCADHRGDADHREQGNGKTHRRQQFDAGAQRLRAGTDAHALGGFRHGREYAAPNEKGRDHPWMAPPALVLVVQQLVPSGPAGPGGMGISAGRRCSPPPP